MTGKIDWVNCPVCDEPDMKRKRDGEGNVIIHCVNHSCKSNGGHYSIFPIIHLCSMKESNGKETWIVMLTKTKEESIFRGLQVYSDSIKGRAEYEADRLKYFFGQGPEPDILKYDTK